MSSKVTATLVVNFDGGNGSGHLSAEIDSRPTGYNGGRTNFTAGDSPAFLVFNSSDVSVDSIVSSAGAIVDASPPVGLMEVSEDLQFSGTAEAQPSKPIYGGLTSAKWLGNTLGDGSLQVTENKVAVTAAGVGVLRVKYFALFKAYRLTAVPYPLNGETSFPVLIVITGSKA
jgi:hypothetical protein